jgi:hypothetical protein
VGFVYSALAIGLVYVLRTMSRRFHQGDESDHDVPYGPRPETSTHSADDPVGVS